MRREKERWRGPFKLLSAALFLLVLSGPDAQACYSGLIIIPTADVTGPLAWVLDIQWQGYSTAFRTDQLIVNSEWGIGDRFEMGLDVDATGGPVDHRALLNAKYVLLRSDPQHLAVAVGLQNMNRSFDSYPYLVATKDWGILRTHAGIQHEEGNRNRWFVGVDRTVGEHWQVMADHTAGSENYSSAGIGWCGASWQVMVGGQWPDAGGSSIVVVHVVLTGSFKSHAWGR